jgi:DNA-binding SARP family transcriptional activator
LFTLLDRLREHAVVWIVGPPGSGKTTLMASYVEASRAPVVWYLVDRADSDPATFFLYLAQAVGSTTSSRRNRLPMLTPEYISDLDGFSRRFFREVFTRLADGYLLVLDNFHEISAESELQRMLSAAIGEVPQSANLILISRQPPPASFSRAQITGNVAVLGWEELRLQPAETATIVGSRNCDDPKSAAAIHAQSGGWAAGVRLLLEGEHKVLRGEPLTTADALEPAFDYFAEEVFIAVPDTQKSVLIRTAFLPRFTARMAEAISGDASAGQQLEKMYKRRLFIDKRTGAEVTYQYHDLFRAFLCDQATSRLSATGVATLISDSAHLLQAGNLIDEAFALFVRVGNWENAEEIFLAQARTLIASGRWLTLDEWAHALPKARLEANPWLLYWLGSSKALVDAATAFPILESSYELFVARQDQTGRVLCAAAIVETVHFFIEQWETMGVWLNRLRDDLDAHQTLLSADDELRVHTALFWAAENSDPGSQIIAVSVSRVMELLPGCTDVNLRISVANILHYHAVRSMDAAATRTAAHEAQAFLDAPELSADRRALYFLAEGMAHVNFSRFTRGLQCYDRADALIAAHELTNRNYIARVWRAQAQYAAGAVRDAEATLARVDSMRADVLPVIAQVLLTVRAWVAFSRDEMEIALRHAQAAIENIDRWGPIIVQGWNLPNQAYLQICAGRISLAREPLERIRSHAWLLSYGRFQGTVALIEAWEALKLSRETRCHEALRECLRLAHDEGERHRMRWYPAALQELLPIALDLDIEPEVVRTLIRECRLDAPADASDRWPWPIKIYALGHFELLIDDQPLEFGRKTPKRTLALLKALIALGGTGVTEQKLIDALWPVQEADAAIESLAAALHRLRRLLGGNDSIHQSGGLLSLNEKRIFIDARRFETEIDDPTKRSLALHLYRGGFLQDDNESWAASMRERLRSKFVRAIETVGRQLESTGHWQEAIDLYLRGLATDELIEPFYRGLMRSYKMLDRSAEAASAFRRLRQILSVTLGTKPSDESQKLFDTLRSH